MCVFRGVTSLSSQGRGKSDIEAAHPYSLSLAHVEEIFIQKKLIFIPQTRDTIRYSEQLYTDQHRCALPRFTVLIWTIIEYRRWLLLRRVVKIAKWHEVATVTTRRNNSQVAIVTTNRTVGFI